jgi:hypothetical protein
VQVMCAPAGVRLAEPVHLVDMSQARFDGDRFCWFPI